MKTEWKGYEGRWGEARRKGGKLREGGNEGDRSEGMKEGGIGRR